MKRFSANEYSQTPNIDVLLTERTSYASTPNEMAQITLMALVIFNAKLRSNFINNLDEVYSDLTVG